ncbi:MAG: VCBS repeat-containing protein [Chloroflexi bacterium]|nr:MAG: VCBS repeat-containing protein [Chloroflexota bacterium]
MKIHRTFTALFLVMTLVLSNVATVFAAPPRVPPLPSSFYGTVKVDGANVPDGTIVQALIDGQVFGQKATTTWGGNSVYALKVVGDDPDTPAKDGGLDGDTIQFKIGELIATQTGMWHSGPNVELNLAAINVYELTVSTSGTGSGTVISDPVGIDCGTDCSETYAYNTPVTLTATAAPGSTFAGWSGEGCAGAGTCAVTMDAAKVVTAEFTQDQYTLTIMSDHGTVTRDPDQATYTYGQDVDLTAIPAEGWSFDNWSGDVNSTDNPVTITMGGNKAVTANYTENPTPITVTADSGQSKVFGDADPVFTYTSSESGVTFTGALSRVAGEDVGTYAITQGDLEAVGNYVITFVSADFSITPKPITVTADAQSKVFGESDPELTYTSSESGVTFTGALSREPGEDVGVYAITQGDLSAGGNYAITFVSADFTIAATSITVTADNGQSKVFGAADPVFTYTSSESGVTFTGALSREPGEDVGAYAITLGTLSAGSNYTITFVSADFTITAKGITVTADSGQSKVFGSADPVFVYASSESGVTFTGALSREPGEDVGSYAITQGDLAAGGNYIITFISADFSITPKPITVTADAQSKPFGAVDPELTYTSSESGVTFTGVLSRVAGEDVGIYAITQGDLAAGGNYTITFVSADFTITPKGITVTADAQSKVFGESDPELSYTSSESGVTFTGALSRVAGEDVGIYAITQGDLLAGGNYIITFVSADLTINPKPITVTADSGQSKVFGAVDPVFTYTSSESGLTFTGALSRAAGEDVGIYAITQGDLSAGSNYVITFVPADFSITPRPITVTADAQSKVFGTVDPELTYTSSESGVTFSGALSRVAGEDVGIYAITQGDLSTGGNYAITFVSADFTITAKGIIVTADAQSKVFGAADPVFTYTSSESGVTFTGALSREPGENVGVYAITRGDLSAGSNYAITFVSADLTINAKPVTVTGDSGQSKVFGSADPVFTYTSSESGVTFTGALSREAGEDVGDYAIEQGTLSAGSNYAITFVSADFTVTPKGITVTADAKSKVFGETDPALTYASSEGGITFTGTLSREAGENVGVYAVTQGDLSAGGNYVITFVSADFTIAAKGITVTADAQSKIFGESDPELTYTSPESGVTFTGALSREAGENVGVYAVTQGDLSAGSNYTITFVSADFTITPASATITLSDLIYFYDGSPKSATVATDPPGLSVSVTYNGSALPPTLAGSYAVNATITDPNYTGTASGTLEILKRVPADFDGDGATEISYFRPSNGRWYVLGSPSVAFGASGDIPVPADYDGDGDSELAYFRPSNGRWYVLGSPSVAFGASGDIPVPGDYDGDGDSELAYFRPSNGRWYVLGQPSIAFGASGDIPIPADYDGDGDMDIAYFRPSNNRWYVLGQPSVAFGASGAIPMPGDYDGDGDVDLAYFLPSNNRWYVLGNPSVAYGASGAIPAPGDYDGDGDIDLAYFLPSNGRWYVLGNPSVAYGTSGDFPLPVRDTNGDGDPHQ